MTEMPRYKCHKEVQALKIKEVKTTRDMTGAIEGATLVFEDERYGPLRVFLTFVRKHSPQAGGYYVLYKDGYESWSPAKEFEDGYTVIAP